MISFDVFAWDCFYYDSIARKEAEKLLVSKEIGTFLLRESGSTSGYSLCVKVANEQFHHYLIEKVDANNKESGEMCYSYRISMHSFSDMPSLLNYFKLHNLTLDPTPVKLVRPLEKAPIERVVAKYKFDGERVSDLPFERGEELDVLGKPEEHWWTARNCLGGVGLIPANRVKPCAECDELSLLNPSTNSSSVSSSQQRLSANSIFEPRNEGEAVQIIIEERQPSTQGIQTNCWVQVKADRLPSIYDVEALAIKKGQFLFLQEILSNGMCKGRGEDSKIGLFPITYVERVENEEIVPR